MKKFILLLTALLGTINLCGQTKYCSKIENEVIVKKTYLTISYNPGKKIPNYVGYYILPGYLSGSAKRESTFYAETLLLKSYRSYTSNYVNSGYDRGHMSPAADWKFSKTAMHETFSMANICPQKSNLNRYYWSYLEDYERECAQKCDTLFVVTGEICGPSVLKKNSIGIPDYFYKTFVGVKGGEVIIRGAWLYRNINTKQTMKGCELSIPDLEKKLGYDIFQGFWFNNLIK